MEEKKLKTRMKPRDPEFDWLERCPFCQGTRLPCWELAEPGYSVHNLRVRCEDCGLVFSNPQASRRRLAYFYNHVYFEAKDYKGEYFGEASAMAQAAKAAEELALLESLGSKGSILDVGCAAGYFLEEARRKGWKVEGSELSEEAARAARQKGIRVHVGETERLKLGAQFDVVHAAHTLEHVKDPIGFLRHLKGFLKPGGRLLVECPNLNQLWALMWHWSARFKGQVPPLRYAKEHTFDFSLKTFRDAFQLAGLRIERARIYEDPSGLLRLWRKADDSAPKILGRLAFVAFTKLLRLEARFGNYLQVVARADP